MTVPMNEGQPLYPAPKSQGFAIAGFVLGIASCLPVGCCCGGVVVPVLAIVFSAVALSKVKDGTGGGKEFAVAGLVCGIVGTVLWFLWTLFTLFGGSIIEEIMESLNFPPDQD